MTHKLRRLKNDLSNLLQNKVKIVSFLLLFSMLNVSVLHAAKPVNKVLDKFFQKTQTMQANFVQTVSNTRGKLIERSIGSLVLSRPDKFILNYNSPAEQQYISNGQTIWIYDLELEQVSIKELDATIGESPALLLSSNADVYKHYDVQNLAVQQGEPYRWIELKAQKEEMTFERVLLAFKDTVLTQMKMYDSFGQVTVLKFSDIQINKHFALKKFNFIAPEGVDVIGNHVIKSQ